MLDGVLLLTMLVYLRCLGNGFVFDDHEMIVINRYLGQWSFLWKSLVNDSWWFRDPLHLPQSSYYRPLQDIWLGIHYQLFGLVPGGWHATMIALHLAAVWMTFKIASRLTGDWRTAILVAALFGLLPIHAEAVVWPTAIPLPLSAVLELAAFYLFIARRDAARGSGYWAGAMLLYAGALFTHESAVAFPAIVAAYVFLIETPPPYPDDEPRPDTSAARARRALRLAAPFAAETLAYLIVRYLVLGFINRANPVNHATIAQVLMTIPPALPIYLGLLAMPWFAGPSHRLMMVTGPSSAEFWLGVLVLGVVAGGFFGLVRIDPRRRLYLFCAAWIAIAIAPMMNLGGLFQQGLIQDRYLYMASFGWCLIVANVAVRYAGRSARARRVVLGATGALALSYAATLWHVQGFWHDEVALFTRCIEEFPESAIWHNRLGMALEERGELVPAERELSASLRLDPGDGATLYDLGLLHARLGRVSEGASEVAEGLKLVPHAPAMAYVSLAQIYIGRRSRSERSDLEVRRITPGRRRSGWAGAGQHQDRTGRQRRCRADPARPRGALPRRSERVGDARRGTVRAEPRRRRSGGIPAGAEVGSRRPADPSLCRPHAPPDGPQRRSVRAVPPRAQRRSRRRRRPRVDVGDREQRQVVSYGGSRRRG